MAIVKVIFWIIFIIGIFFNLLVLWVWIFKLLDLIFLVFIIVIIGILVFFVLWINLFKCLLLIFILVWIFIWCICLVIFWVKGKNWELIGKSLIWVGDNYRGKFFVYCLIKILINFFKELKGVLWIIMGCFLILFFVIYFKLNCLGKL